MFGDFMRQTLRRELIEQLTAARRQLREQEQRLARLKYEWNIAKRLRSQAHSEDEREKWRVQSDVYMGLVVQQESAVKETQEHIDRHQTMLAKLDAPTVGETGQ